MRSMANSLFFAAAVSGASQASTVIFETGSSIAGPQADAFAYRTVVEEALALPGAHSTFLGLFDSASNHTVFRGGITYIAYRFTIQFEVTAAAAGDWGIRAGVDFGWGGAVFLDGTALAHNPNNMWWAGSYADPSQSFQFPSLPLTAGTHTLQIYGLEDCCDGGHIGQQGQFSINAGTYTTFGVGDGLLPAIPVVPEPQTFVLLLTGLGVVACVTRCSRRGLIRSSPDSNR